MTDADSILARMTQDVIGRQRKPVVMTAPGKTVTPAGSPPGPTLSGSVEQAHEVTKTAWTAMRAEAALLRERATALETAAAHLEFGMQLVFSEYKAGADPKPLDVEAMRRKAEAEADAKHQKPEPAAVPADDDGWVCPDHGQVRIKTSTRTGREYKGCPVDGCPEVEPK